MASWLRFFQRAAKEQDLDAEIEAHLALDIQQRVERGESPDDARRSARKEFGNVAMVKEVTRGVWTSRFLDILQQNLRYSIQYTAKTIRREFWLSIVTVLSVAVAIACNIAIFRLVNGVLFKGDTKIGHIEQLVHTARISREETTDSFSYAALLDLSARRDVFTGVAGYEEDRNAAAIRTEAGLTAIMYPAYVSANFFDVFAVSPAAGRFFHEEEEHNAPVAVISHRTWESLFAGQASAIGRVLRVNGRAFTVVGIAPEGFGGTPSFLRSDLWIPFTMSPFAARLSQQSHSWVKVLARLRTDVTMQQAQAALTAGSQTQGRMILSPQDAPPEGLRAGAAMVMAVPIVVLLIACANVAGVGLARGSARTREIALRLALGATRRRVVLQLATETVPLFALAAIGGTVLGRWLTDLLASTIPLGETPLELDFASDTRVILFTLALTLFSALVSGLIPALQITRTDVSTAVKQDLAAMTYRRFHLRNALVVGQIALSLILLIGGGLFLRSLRHVWTDQGFDSDDVYVAALNFATTGLDERAGRDLSAVLAERVASLPGIASAALATDLPLNGEDQNTSIGIPGQRAPTPRGWFQIPFIGVTPGYFAAMRIPIVKGRGFNDMDRETSPPVAVISSSMARRFWPDEDPIGKSFNYCGGGCETTIIGIAGDTQDDHRESDFAVYRPLLQRNVYMSRVSLVFRTTDGPVVIPTVRRLIEQLHPDLMVISLRSLNQVMSGGGLYLQWLGLWISGAMGIFSVLLAALGIYGVTSYAVTCRTREIGIRTALGARPGTVLRLMLREGLTLSFLGLLAGSGAALGVTGLIAGALYGVTPTDATSFVTAGSMVFAITLIATYLPTRRAARVDPLIALRHK
jgi:predicted permease